MTRLFSRTVLAIALGLALQSCSGDDPAPENYPTLSAGSPTISSIDTATNGPANLEVVDFISATLTFR